MPSPKSAKHPVFFRQNDKSGIFNALCWAFCPYLSGRAPRTAIPGERFPPICHPEAAGRYPSGAREDPVWRTACPRFLTCVLRPSAGARSPAAGILQRFALQNDSCAVILSEELSQICHPEAAGRRTPYVERRAPVFSRAFCVRQPEHGLLRPGFSRAL